MKKFAILAAVVALIGCTQNDEGLDKITNTPVKSQTEFYASMPECDTRTYVEDNKYLRWNAVDEITIFAGNSYNGHWQFAGEDGANSGKFNEIEEGGFVTGTPLDLTANYAIYPYDENITITEAGVVSLTLPAVQEYNHTYANSFGEGANTMMAVTENTSDNFLAFKNLCGYLKLKFYGEDVTVKSITVKGNNGEKIAGPATVSMAYGDEPTITMADDATDTITIDCGEGVALSNDAVNPTTFWVVIPETTFEGGITIEVTDINDQTFSKQTTNTVPIENNLIQPMAALEVESIEPTPPNNQIWYTATNMITPYEYAQNAFNVPWIEHVFLVETGEGVITFDGDLTKIGDEAFMFCDKLNTITIPDSVTSIGDNAFSYCESLTSITIPAGVTSIGNGAFDGCSSLASITIPEGVTSIGEQAFNGCSSLASITIPDGVTSIGSRAFSGCYSLTNIIIPDGVTSIGYSVFNYCKSLASITIPEGVTSIGNYAFNGCSSLASITIPEGVTSIGMYAFNDCSSLASITIPEGVTSIGERTFFGCSSITSISIPDGVTSIGKQAFNGCSSLASITIPEGVTSIGSSAFSGCSSLASITIPEGVTSIGSSAFSGCSSLAEFKGKFASKDGRCVVVDGVLRFFAPAGLDEYTIPDSVTSIGDSAFYGTNISHIEIPDAVQSIGKWAFQNCTKLSNVNLGKGVILLDNMAFEGCVSLREVTIPNSLQQIGLYVFYKCSNLSSVYCCPQTPPSPKGTASELKYWWCFNDTASDLQIFVPIASESKYKSQRGWRDYADKIVGYDFTE